MMLWSGLCENGNWREGSGGWGGLDNQEGRGGQLYWVCHDSTGCHKHFRIAQSVAPKKYPWHDIHSMSGSGSSGKSITLCGGCWAQGNCWARASNQTGTPEDSGEGAGTGGAVYGGSVCTTPGVDWPAHCLTFGIDWLQVCDLGVAGKATDVYYRESTTRDLVPGFISRAGTLGGSGGIEAVATVMAIANDQVPPTINLENPDAECDLDYVPHVSRALPVEVALSNSFGFGGVNASLIFSKLERS
jgi:hypothetical protein